MLVNFRICWFDPNGKRYRPENNPHLVDESLRSVLPSTADVVEPTVVVQNAEPTKEKPRKSALEL